MRHEVWHQLVEEGLGLAQLVAMAQGSSNDSAQHIATTFIARNDAIDNEEAAGADVVCNDPQRWVFDVGATGLTGGRADQALEEVDLVIAVHALEHRGNALKAHARVHARARQRVEHPGLVTVVLHEDQVPDLDVAVAVFIR